MKMSTEKIDIIVITYKTTDVLINCLQSIAKHNDSNTYNIYIVNNFPSETIEKQVKGIPRTHVISNHTNLGFARAVNRALAFSSAPFVCILNPDAIIHENAIQVCLEYLESHPDVGIVGPKVYNEDGTVQGSARFFPTLLTALFGRSSWLTRVFPNNPISKKNIVSIGDAEAQPVDVDWVSGACMVVRRAAVRAIGGMDERFFMYWEDADWCRRMHLAGWRVVYVAKASVSHACGKSSVKRPFKSIIHFHTSCYRLYEKYTPANQRQLLAVALLGLSLRMICMLFLTVLRHRPERTRSLSNPNR